MNPQTKHVCVVGAGIVGLSTAWRLLQDGWQVSIIEESAAPGLVTSYANGAQLSYSYVAPLAEPSAITSLPKWLLKKDGPLRIHPSLSPEFLRWSVSFAAHCTTASAHQTTRDLLGLGYLSRRVLREWYRGATSQFAHFHRGICNYFRYSYFQSGHANKKANVHSDHHTRDYCR